MRQVASMVSFELFLMVGHKGVTCKCCRRKYHPRYTHRPFVLDSNIFKIRKHFLLWYAYRKVTFVPIVL